MKQLALPEEGTLTVHLVETTNRKNLMRFHLQNPNLNKNTKDVTSTRNDEISSREISSRSHSQGRGPDVVPNVDPLVSGPPPVILTAWPADDEQMITEVEVFGPDLDDLGVPGSGNGKTIESSPVSIRNDTDAACEDSDSDKPVDMCNYFSCRIPIPFSYQSPEYGFWKFGLYMLN